MFCQVDPLIQKRGYEGDTWQAFEDNPQLVEELFQQLLAQEEGGEERGKAEGGELLQNQREYVAMMLARMAKHIPSIKQRLLDMIPSSNPTNTLPNEITTTTTTTTTMQLSVIAALQYEKILPPGIWEQYKQRVIQWMGNLVHNDCTVCVWKDLLTEECKYLFHKEKNGSKNKHNL